MAVVAIFSQIKLLFGPLVIQLVWYILKQLFTSVSVKVLDIYLATSRLGKYPPLFSCNLFFASDFFEQCHNWVLSTQSLSASHIAQEPS